LILLYSKIAGTLLLSSNCFLEAEVVMLIMESENRREEKRRGSKFTELNVND
jgi:hypothetical protein